MTEYVLRKGDIAVATLRKPEKIDDLQSQFPADKLLVLKLDIRNKQDIADAFSKAKQAFGKINFVFNSAGYHIAPEVKGASDETRDLFDLSFWGAVNVTKLAIKFLRESNPPGVGGSILQMSFVKGQDLALNSDSCSTTYDLHPLSVFLR
jgi:NAD(P)-dependent dehydrogenase (short-subunit alcohol dehydrogenase family)